MAPDESTGGKKPFTVTTRSAGTTRIVNKGKKAKIKPALSGEEGQTSENQA